MSKELRILNEMKKYYFTGSTRSISFRKEQLKKLKYTIKNYEDEIIDALEVDLGRHELESYAAEIGSVLSSISFNMRHLRKWMKKKKVKTPITQFGSKSYIKPEPYGVVLIVGPFNFPFNLAIEPLIGAIVSGNCSVIKPSEQTPNVSRVIRSMIEEIFPENYIAVIEGERDTITRLINLPFDYIFFTGSVPVGKIVMEAASKNLIPVTLELGGKSPCIVDKNANIKVASQRIAWGKFFNAGQICVAPDYIYLDESIADEFLREFINTIKVFYGENIKTSKDFSRIVNERHTKRLIDIIEMDKEKICFGGDYDLESRYISPTIINNATWSDKSMEDEIFGPILPIITYSDLDMVIREINIRQKPLALYVFSEDNFIQNKIINQTSSGGSCINDTISHFNSHHLPFGGVGHAGMGSYHGEMSFKTFSHMKSILNKSTKINLDIAFPPYSKGKLKLIKRLLK
ncbi:MAG: aldehyde dehydrogenase [Firmicutes bacterium]|jgi:aldehyde dehydrogenase (NAD+)|nr:aldehyde dehydrogenase [Bacillota bacterium]